MKEKYRSTCDSLENSKKLEFYKVFKNEYSKSHYLHQLRPRPNFVSYVHEKFDVWFS